jgi:hypothetical protein
MTVGELIAELSKVTDLNAKVNIVVGTDDDNCILGNTGIIVQEGVDNDDDSNFVEICAFSGEEL